MQDKPEFVSYNKKKANSNSYNTNRTTQNFDEELRGIASADQNAISIIEKNIDLDHELCQCKCMKKFDAYMEARNVTNMFVYN